MRAFFSNQIQIRRFGTVFLHAPLFSGSRIITKSLTTYQASSKSSEMARAAHAISNAQHEDGPHSEQKEATVEKPKTEKDLEKERKRAEKQKKFDEKQRALAINAASGPSSRTNEKKARLESGNGSSLPEFKEQTIPGKKKILQSFDDPFHKAYSPKVVESAWYAWWENSGFFKPEFGPDGKPKKEGCFVIPEPPPNVTGSLHMGHALPNAIQDTLIRWSRMRGLTTLWLPGCDHASISTQSVVEKMLWRREKKTKHDLGRQKFNETVMDWKEEYHQKINHAVRRMGASLDWSREAFTMDENHTAATIEHFVRLHEEGVIYRASRLINWCTRLNTGLSNLEVDNIELDGRTLLDVPGYDQKVEFGVMTYFRYEIDGSDETIEIATTRPETILGDTGIAVSPTDTRWHHLVGKNARHPFIPRLLPIFTDEHVDESKGTGAVKLTPAHDFHDFEVGKRHDLEFVNILNDDGTMNHNAGDFEGVGRFEARRQIIHALKAKNLYIRSEDNPMTIPVCQKSKDIIEPRLKPQWWMKMQGMADAAIKAVKDGEITIRPESTERDFYRWLENIHDWCISRQLWWGHQIPAYFVDIDGEPRDEGDGERWVAARTQEEAITKAKIKWPGKTFQLDRDPDILDTWFTSGLWPFSTLGWPRNTSDMEAFYPMSLLETGWDILFFWVARMIMLGIKLTGQVPFREVYCHSLVRDSEGRKMSKSLGNVIDPIDVMEGIALEELHKKLKFGNLDPKELAKAKQFQSNSFSDGIPECGADALRFSLINYTTGGGDINFDIKVMHGYRKFCNKIYQATKYVLGKLPGDFKPLPTASKTGNESLSELWILHKSTIAASEINAALGAREFSKATSASYQYWYTNLCDVYIENSKSIIQDGTLAEQHSAQQTLYTALEDGLKMIHPFMPFISEELWQRLPRRPGDNCPSIVKAAYPQYNKELDDPVSEQAYELILAVSKAVRSLAAEYKIKENANVYIQCLDSEALETCKAQLPSIRSLGGKAMTGHAASVSILEPKDSKPPGCVAQAVGASAAVYLLIKGHVDLNAEIQKAETRLSKAREDVKKQRKIIEGQGWGRIKREIQEIEERRLNNAESEVRILEGSINHFESLK